MTTPAAQTAGTTFKGRDPYVLSPGGVKAPPTTWLGRFRFLGPGMITSAAVVGSGELLTATALGAEVGFILLWLVLVSTFVKVWVQIELGRWSISTGRVAIDGYDDVPPRIGKRGWMAWLVLLMFVQFLTSRDHRIRLRLLLAVPDRRRRPLRLRLHRQLGRHPGGRGHRHPPLEPLRGGRARLHRARVPGHRVRDRDRVRDPGHRVRLDRRRLRRRHALPDRRGRHGRRAVDVRPHRRRRRRDHRLHVLDGREGLRRLDGAERRHAGLD